MQPNTDDPFNLSRFVAAQDPVYAGVCAELRTGRKRSHWMWFIFPQLKGLGRSATADFYGIAGIEEARAYLAHPILGTRLVGCVQLLLELDGVTAQAIFGSPDDRKLQSCLTLFDRAGGPPVFARALTQYFGGRPDAETLRLLALNP
jgi:uncharacterized protein (DUF1810 family)